MKLQKETSGLKGEGSEELCDVNKSTTTRPWRDEYVINVSIMS